MISTAPKYESKVTFVTAQMASRWLAESNGHNRRLNDSAAKLFAEEITSGRYVPTHQGIAFDVNGNVADGQHRLRGIVLAGGKSSNGFGIWIMVTRGLPVEARDAIDMVRPRSLGDVLAAGSSGRRLAGKHSEILNSMYNGPSPNWVKLSNTFGKRVYENYQDAVEFSASLPGLFSVGTRLAGYRGVLARAFYHISHNVIAEFNLVVCSESLGSDVGPARTALSLQKTLINRKSSGGKAYRCGVYRLTQNALHNFANGTEVKVCRESSGDLFPLPPLKGGD